MTNDFKGFSDAARLYADNFEIVDTMREAYESDVKSFLEVFEREIQRIVAPEPLGIRRTGARNRYWWLGKSVRGDSPYLWFNDLQPSEVSHRGLVVLGGTDQKDDDVVSALVALPEKADLGLTKYGSPSRDAAFTLSVEFTGDDFIEPAARRVADVLKAMREVELFCKTKKKRRK